MYKHYSPLIEEQKLWSLVSVLVAHWQYLVPWILLWYLVKLTNSIHLANQESEMNYLPLISLNKYHHISESFIMLILSHIYLHKLHYHIHTLRIKFGMMKLCKNINFVVQKNMHVQSLFCHSNGPHRIMILLHMWKLLYDSLIVDCLSFF